MRNLGPRWRRSVAMGVLCSGALFTTTACGEDNETSGVVSEIEDKAGEVADDAKKAADEAAEQVKETAGEVKDEADAAKDKVDHELGDGH